MDPRNRLPIRERVVRERNPKLARAEINSRTKPLKSSKHLNRSALYDFRAGAKSLRLWFGCGGGAQVGVEEVVDAVPSVQQHVFAREIVKLAGINHERD